MAQAIGPYGAYSTEATGRTPIGPYGMYQQLDAVVPPTPSANAGGGGPGSVSEMRRMEASQLQAIRADDERLLELLEDQGFVVIHNPD